MKVRVGIMRTVFTRRRYEIAHESALCEGWRHPVGPPSGPAGTCATQAPSTRALSGRCLEGESSTGSSSKSDCCFFDAIPLGATTGKSLEHLLESIQELDANWVLGFGVV